MITFAKGPDGGRVHVDDTKSRVEYTCFVCGAPLVPNKGDVYRHHFKHKGGRACTDTWHGTYCDSEWHFSWQERYPQKNRERVLELGSTRHRADVVVGETVIEFQHSTLSKAQFDDRNAFYGDLGHKVVWLFDLREAYAKGEIVPGHSEDAGPGMLPTSFVWHNPKQAFNAYDPLRGDVDLLFQLADDNGGKCIVRVEESCDAGFEEFRVSTWLTAQEFLAHTGLDAKGCPEPNLAPLEPNPDYVRFRERYDVRLNPQQERSAQVVDGSTLLLAVPGSGKTTTMVARLGYLTVERHVDPKSVIALTYGRDAANEMRTRFARQFRDQALANVITFSTINAFCLRIYHEWCEKNPEHRPKRELIQENEARKLLGSLYREATGKFVSEAMLIGLATTINWLKNSMLEPDDLPWLDEETPHFTQTYERYCQRLKEDRKMDFDDQLRFAKYALEHDEELLEEYRSRYRYWCVDEAQDTSKIQHHIIRMLAGAEGSGNVFMVGDEDQSIYGYRGAYPQALLSFPFDYPNARTLRMETNYRSGDEIVSAARTFIGGCKGRIEKRMVSGRGPGSVVRVEEVPHRLDQFDATITLIRNHQREESGTLAVLYRNNETAIPLVDQLIRKGVAFTLSGNANTLFTSPTVRDVKAFMRLALDPRDKDSLSHVYMKAQCYIKKKDYEWACRRSRRDGIDLLQGLVDGMSSHPNKRRARLGRQNAQRFSTLVRTIASLTPREAIEHLLENGYGEWLEDQGKSSRTIDLLKPIAGREQSIRSFLDRLEFLSTSFDKKHPNHLVSGALTLATTHSCKGSEFDKVVIVDAIDGIFPSSRRDPLDYGKDEARNWQEERRLFYVAMTRAKDELVLMRPADEAAPFVDEVFPRPVPTPDPEVTPASNATTSLPSVGAPVPDATILQKNGQSLLPAPSPEAAPVPVPDSELPSTLNTPSSALTSETHLLHSSEPKTPPSQGPSQPVPNSEALSSPAFIPKPAPNAAPIPRATRVPNLPTPAPTHEAGRTLDVPPSAPIPSPGVSSGCRGEVKIGGASIIQETLGTDSVPAQSKVSRYDVDTWEVLEDRGPSFRRVACGSTFAEVTSGIAGKTLDLMVPWTEDQVPDVADHLHEYAHGRTEVAVHFDVTGAQRMRDVRPHAVGVNRIALRLEDDSLFEALSRLIRELEKLEASSAILLLDCLMPNGPSGERRVLDVDDKSRCVLVSADLYDE